MGVVCDSSRSSFPCVCAKPHGACVCLVEPLGEDLGGAVILFSASSV